MNSADTTSDLPALSREGALACASGVPAFDNPFFAPDFLPVATGEPASEWGAKADAWRVGWEIEFQVRRLMA